MPPIIQACTGHVFTELKHAQRDENGDIIVYDLPDDLAEESKFFLLQLYHFSPLVAEFLNNALGLIKHPFLPDKNAAPSHPLASQTVPQTPVDTGIPPAAPPTSRPKRGRARKVSAKQIQSRKLVQDKLPAQEAKPMPYNRTSQFDINFLENMNGNANGTELLSQFGTPINTGAPAPVFSSLSSSAGGWTRANNLQPSMLQAQSLPMEPQLSHSVVDFMPNGWNFQGAFVNNPPNDFNGNEETLNENDSQLRAPSALTDKTAAADWVNGQSAYTPSQSQSQMQPSQSAIDFLGEEWSSLAEGSGSRDIIPGHEYASWPQPSTSTSAYPTMDQLFYPAQNVPLAPFQLNTYAMAAAQQQQQRQITQSSTMRQRQAYTPSYPGPALTSTASTSSQQMGRPSHFPRNSQPLLYQPPPLAAWTQTSRAPPDFSNFTGTQPSQ